MRCSYILLLFFSLLFLLEPARAGNIQVSRTKLELPVREGAPASVVFDLSWDNSWRDTLNWDAAWVFMKYSTDGGITWQHGYMEGTGNSAGKENMATPGLLDEGREYNARSNPVVGVLVYRGREGWGRFSSRVTLFWNSGSIEQVDVGRVQVAVLAIEMVYVPAGSYYLGSGGDEPCHFYRYPDPGVPYRVESDDSLPAGRVAGSLYCSRNPLSPSDGVGGIPASYPVGYDGFYCMKHEVSQGEYACFLGMLLPDQSSHLYSSSSQGHGYGIIKEGSGYKSDHPGAACNWLSWVDGCAYADWSGLRPMTELEYEKSCRGSRYPVPCEYAWGTTLARRVVLPGQGTGEPGEGRRGRRPSPGGCCVYRASSVVGPVPTGILEQDEGRRPGGDSGASYYGIMELSGNLCERMVTIDTRAGRSYGGSEGDGELNGWGVATNADWPGCQDGHGVTGGNGTGIRGGSWFMDVGCCRVSDRSYSTFPGTSRFNYTGFRCVRDAPGE